MSGKPSVKKGGQEDGSDKRVDPDRMRVGVGESEAGARQWEDPGDPRQITKTPASSLKDLSLKFKPARAETGWMSLDETKQGRKGE